VAHHHTVFQAMKIIMGKRYCELANYFDSCRSKKILLIMIIQG